ncbi:MAG: ABC transporter permease [Thermoanaerobaculales bacterium]|jgi:peptide/nickel transport system permease protein|nr:ABC transporter permease [Thermoanaerobaculales bacterium]
MRRAIAAHALRLVAVLFAVSVGTFGLFALAPGDPAEVILRDRSEEPDPGQVAALRRELGLDDPLPVRYARWLAAACRGDLGRSWRTGAPASSEVVQRMPATLQLAGCSFLLVLAMSAVGGAVAAFNRGRGADHALRIASVLTISIPSYWLGLLLIMTLAVQVGWLPVMGRGGPAHLVLPSLTLAAGAAALQGRVLRATLLQVMAADHIRFAQAKGLPPRTVLLRHALPNALPPLVTMWAVSLGHLLGGSVVVETVFAWPGVGQLTVASVLGRDIPVVQAILLTVAAVFMVVNLAADGINRRLDPRLARLGGGGPS